MNKELQNDGDIKKNLQNLFECEDYKKMDPAILDWNYKDIKQLEDDANYILEEVESVRVHDSGDNPMNKDIQDEVNDNLSDVLSSPFHSDDEEEEANLEQENDPAKHNIINGMTIMLNDLSSCVIKSKKKVTNKEFEKQSTEKKLKDEGKKDGMKQAKLCFFFNK